MLYSLFYFTILHNAYTLLPRTYDRMLIATAYWCDDVLQASEREESYEEQIGTLTIRLTEVRHCYYTYCYPWASAHGANGVS